MEQPSPKPTTTTIAPSTPTMVLDVSSGLEIQGSNSNQNNSNISVLPKASANKGISTIANLANLLPTGMVLTFEALESTFSYNDKCYPSNRTLTIFSILSCSFFCIISTFSDSFTGINEKLYYGIATRNGLYVFNDSDSSDGFGKEELRGEDHKKYKLNFRDFVHAIGSVLVFLVIALSNSNAKRCLFPNLGDSGEALIKNLPLVVALFVSLLFFIFPTKRRGFGFADVASR